LKANADTSRLVAATILDDLNALISGDASATLLEEVGKMKFSIMPRTFKEKDEDLEKLAFILPKYFCKNEGQNVAPV
jgi:5'-methylthioadenosine phosphorylase